jgi:hypothetical protein
MDGDNGNRGPDYAIMVADVAVGPANNDGSTAGGINVTNVREVFRDLQYGFPTFGYGNRRMQVLIFHMTDYEPFL